MTERTYTPIDIEPRIEVTINNDRRLFTLEGTVKGERMFLALSTSGENPTELINRLNGHYPVLRRHYYGETILISHSEIFRLHSSLKPSQSAHLGSKTEYAGQTENKEIALQVVEQFKMSKPPHSHNGLEFYHHVNGELAVRMQDLNNGEVTEEILSQENPLVIVPESCIHQVKAMEGVAISVLICDFTRHEYHPELNLFG